MPVSFTFAKLRPCVCQTTVPEKLGKQGLSDATKGAIRAFSGSGTFYNIEGL
jgi:hypothetical protein